MSDKPLLSQSFARIMLALLAIIYIASTFHFADRGTSGFNDAMVDFDSFYLIGRMAWDGTIANAYQSSLFFKLQQDLGQNLFMPWTYPPPFNLVVAPLALLPLPIAYAVFMGPALFAYVLTLRHLAGRFLPFTLAATAPALIITVRCGQNGMLTATLLGLVCAGLLNAKPASGIPLGLMIIKPHLAVTSLLTVVLQKRWRTLAIAAITALVAVALSAGLLGPQIWTAFLAAVSEAKFFLTEGYYRFYRMVSIYAALKTIGFTPSASIAGQIVGTVAVMGLVTWSVLWHRPLRDTLGLATITAPFITPYAYDYDLCLLAIGLALLGPTIEHLMSRPRQITLLLLYFTGCGAGLAQGFLTVAFPDRAPSADTLISLGAWPLLAAVALIAKAMWRAERASSPPPLGHAVRALGDCVTRVV